MALFESPGSSREEVIGSDVGTRALSVTAVETDFVNDVYDKLAKVYDWTFGPTLHPGRVQAIQRMGIKRGDRVLDVRQRQRFGLQVAHIGRRHLQRRGGDQVPVSIFCLAHLSDDGKERTDDGEKYGLPEPEGVAECRAGNRRPCHPANQPGPSLAWADTRRQLGASG